MRGEPWISILDSLPQLLLISFIHFYMLSIVWPISSTGNSAKVLFTPAENSSKFSSLSWWVIASSVNFSWTRLKMFSIGFTSDVRAGIANTLQPVASIALLAWIGFWIGLPYCKNNLFLGLILTLNTSGKSSWLFSQNFYNWASQNTGCTLLSFSWMIYQLATI